MARRPRRNALPSPLEQRDGIDPVRIRLPGPGEGRPVRTGAGSGAAPGANPRTEPGAGIAPRPAAWHFDGDPPWSTVADHLLARYSRAIGPERVAAMLAEGRFVTADGPVDARTPYEPGTWVWYHRDLAPERPVPFPIGIVYRDERIVVADKPHFLATTPRGRHITETALARLRRDLGLPFLSPAHRLDRLTAGLALFVVRPGDRGAYQTLFHDRKVRKEYEAVAAYDPAVTLPRTVRSRIVKERGRMAAEEVPGPPNAESRVELTAHRDGLGRYRLLPATGRTHQLRVHMNALGLPLLNDPIYPLVLPDPPDDGLLDEPAAESAHFARPLQLLARALEFTDPVTGRELRFESTRRLACWPEAAGEG